MKKFSVILFLILSLVVFNYMGINSYAQSPTGDQEVCCSFSEFCLNGIKGGGIGPMSKTECDACNPSPGCTRTCSVVGTPPCSSVLPPTSTPTPAPPLSSTPIPCEFAQVGSCNESVYYCPDGKTCEAIFDKDLPGRCGCRSTPTPTPPPTGCRVNNDCEPCYVCRTTNNHGECVFGGNCVNDSNCGQNGKCEKNADDDHVCECRYLSNEERCVEKCQPDSIYQQQPTFLTDKLPSVQCPSPNYGKLLDDVPGTNVDRYCCCVSGSNTK